jgi:hypothetical protein
MTKQMVLPCQYFGRLRVGRWQPDYLRHSGDNPRVVIVGSLTGTPTSQVGLIQLSQLIESNSGGLVATMRDIF